MLSQTHATCFARRHVRKHRWVRSSWLGSCLLGMLYSCETKLISMMFCNGASVFPELTACRRASRGTTPSQNWHGRRGRLCTNRRSSGASQGPGKDTNSKSEQVEKESSSRELMDRLNSKLSDLNIQVPKRSSKDEAPPRSTDRTPPQSGVPPPETGRNPQAVANDLVSGVFLIPVALFMAFAFFAINSFLRTTSLPPPEVSLGDSLSALVSIEDEYDARGPKMGLRDRTAAWFKWAQPKRRLEYELQQLPASRLRDRAEKRGKDAADYMASVVEYTTTVGMADGMSGRAADEAAALQAKMGFTEGEKLSEQFLREARKALADAVEAISEAQEGE